MRSIGAVDLAKLGFSQPINLASLCPLLPADPLALLHRTSPSSFPVQALGIGGPCPMAEAITHNPRHIPAPPAPQNPLRSEGGGGPASGSRQPCGPTLPPVLRTCQGHVSTLPNSEFLIMPSMMSLRCSGHTSGRLVAGTAGATGSNRGQPGRTCAGSAKGGGRSGRLRLDSPELR